MRNKEFTPSPFMGISWVCCGYYIYPQVDGREVTVQCSRCNTEDHYRIPAYFDWYTIVQFQGTKLYFSPEHEKERFSELVKEYNDYAAQRILQI